jgi:nucleoside-triphosphatase THEP1
MPETHAPADAPVPSLLIAVTGGPGASKTTVLAELAAGQLARGQRVEGVLALAGKRTARGKGAEEYWLRLIGTDQELSWAVRDESLIPPYYFEPDTERKLHAWAQRLKALPPAPLLILDEFGKLELAGRGLLPVWKVLADARPQIVVIAVRAELVDQIEPLLGRKFDLRIAADSPDALPHLLRTTEDFGEWTRLGLVGGAAGGMEMSVGSMLHAAKVPARGLMMCSLQGAMMTFAGFGLAQPGRVIWVPFISAGLKALSPAGSRVRPMIAICAQGLLYGASVQLLGWNVLAITIGGALIGAWSALQGILLQYLFMGEELIRAYDSTVLWLASRWDVAAPSLPALMGAWAAFCAIIAGGIAATAWKLRAPPAALRRIIERERAGAAGDAVRRGGRWREFTHLQFWLPLVLVSGILLATGRPWESVAWLALRFIVVAFLLMTLVSLLRPARWADYLRKLGWWGPALAMGGALSRRQAPKK